MTNNKRAKLHGGSLALRNLPGPAVVGPTSYPKRGLFDEGAATALAEPLLRSSAALVGLTTAAEQVEPGLELFAYFLDQAKK